jgi:putative nucleotidyltransferase with HDIG domain
VTAAFVALLSSVSSLQDASTAQQAASRELTVVNAAQTDVFAMETALRGYALTRERRYVVSYDAATRAFIHDAALLAVAERRDDGAEDPGTRVINRSVLGYERSYAMIEPAGHGRTSRRELTNRTAAATLRLDTIRHQISRQLTITLGDTRRGQLRAQGAAAATKRFAVFGLIALICLIAAFSWAMRRGIALPLTRLRRRAERLARGDRGSRMPRSRLRELDDLGSSFDSMADAVTAGRQKLEAQKQNLEERVRARTVDLETARLEILTRLARAAEYRDDATRKHTERVARTARQLALALRLSPERSELIALAAPLHDIGKIGVPDAVLLKPGKLTDDEFAIMKTHAHVGANMLAGSESPLLRTAAAIAQHHHERWDGTGYPEGRHGKQIPLSARIVAVADVLDALTHERPYKPAWPVQDALQEIFSQSGRQFDPRVIDALHQLDHRQLLPRQSAIQLENDQPATRR